MWTFVFKWHWVIGNSKITAPDCPPSFSLSPCWHLSPCNNEHTQESLSSLCLDCCNNPKVITQRRCKRVCANRVGLFEWQGCESAHMPCKNPGNKGWICHWTNFHEMSSLNSGGVSQFPVFHCCWDISVNRQVVKIVAANNFTILECILSFTSPVKDLSQTILLMNGDCWWKYSSSKNSRKDFLQAVVMSSC